MKHIKDRNNFPVKESISTISVHLSPVTLILLTSFYLNRKEAIKNMKSNITLLKDSFLQYCNLMGYTIDKEVLDSEFVKLIEQVKKTLKM